MDLFEAQHTESLNQPLSERLRPKAFDDFLTQNKSSAKFENIIAQLKNNVVFNLILWGPPGSGKTSFANILKKNSTAEFIQSHAVDLSTKVIKEYCEAAKSRMLTQNKKTILFIDEIHRLNKSQQDIFLQFIEKGFVYLLGATTENPSYELNKAIMSRCKLLFFEPHDDASLKSLFIKALNTEDITQDQIITPEALEALINSSQGDARLIINKTEELIQSYQFKTLNFPLSLDDLKKFFFESSIAYDKTGDEHYNLISAFIKSIRGSDPNAGIYYLARMLYAGEDPVFIARRLIILASEDVGNADPNALTLAISTLKAVEVIGMPEARINLAQCVCYLASAPKSNAAYLAINKALNLVERTKNLKVPLALRSAQTELMKQLGYGKDYKYSHDFPKHWVSQDFLPKEIQGEVFYEPTDIGFEKRIREYLEWLKK
jgi:putative ATPase